MADKKKTYYTHITQIDMIRAQEDPEFISVILERLRPFLYYLSYIIYDFYGAKYDYSLDRDDIMSFLDISIVKAIKAYDPLKYDPKKDKTGDRIFLDGFRYISAISKRLVKHFHRYHNRKKRIPPNQVFTLDPDFYIEPTMNDTDDQEHSKNVIYPSDLDMLFDDILSAFKNQYHENINIHEVMKLLFTGYSHKQISDIMSVNIKDIEKIIKDSIIDCRKSSKQMVFGFFNSVIKE